MRDQPHSAGDWPTVMGSKQEIWRLNQAAWRRHNYSSPLTERCRFCTAHLDVAVHEMESARGASESEDVVHRHRFLFRQMPSQNGNGIS